jgi:Uma2 family endonuclease
MTVEAIKTEATVEDLYRVPDNGKAELVNGELILMSPTGGAPGRASARIWRSLDDYEQRTGRGYAFPDNVGFLVNLPHRRSFSPDVAFHVGPDPDIDMRFAVGAPVFAVEVRSENDYGEQAEQKMRDKRADYFAAGTQVVWDVDLLGPEVIRSYQSGDPDHPAAIFRRGDVADAEPALPGWSLPVDDLFPQRHR